jgi:hypothetical protein
MKWINNPQQRLYLTGAVILLTGLVTSVSIYLSAASDNGFRLEPENSKQHLRELELYGGKANLLADEFLRWFAGLCQGEALAFTIGGISVLISSVVFFIAYNSPVDLESDGRDKDKHP